MMALFGPGGTYTPNAIEEINSKPIDWRPPSLGERIASNQQGLAGLNSGNPIGLNRFNTRNGIGNRENRENRENRAILPRNRAASGGIVSTGNNNIVNQALGRLLQKVKIL